MDGEFFARPPGGVRRLATEMIQVRGAVAMEREKRRTMTELADTLVDSGRAGQVTHRDGAGGQWTITLASDDAQAEWHG
ncbi:hypothetical protein SAMN06297387_12820 [Streptomyces zhaozhouensis]|uniref:Uncharacterized protein n=1 Tax=Streptomyces zhaozhouensis TaxID=1300267 RepID=A0A286E7V2_9ACTN|nr:hypothetical protein [Streptomyces zhaozhouensis]SOD66976.1 hypothetical protein SAMN06297387_12820 [Streptomyces zhaozhouensis]